MRGSQFNDELELGENGVRARSNNSGGVNGE